MNQIFRKFVVAFTIVISISSVLSLPLLGRSRASSAEMSFDKLDLRTNFGAAEQGKKGRLVVTADTIRFVDKKGKTEYFTIPASAVTDLFYSRVSGRRIKTAVFVTPFLLFSKGKKHYMTISFDDGKDLVGAVEFRLDKSNYRGILHAVESVSGVPLEFDQEGIKDEKETVATGGGGATASAAMASVEITSNPDGADVEIDGAYAGATPRTKALKPGTYKIKLIKKGFKDWKREITVAAGEQIPIHADLEKE